MAATSIFANISTVEKCAALFPKTVAACEDLVKAAKHRAEQSLGKIYGISAADRTFENTAKSIDMASIELEVSASLLSVIASVSPSKEVRDEATKRVVELETFSIDNFESNRQLYSALKEVCAAPAYEAVYASGKAPREYTYWMEEQLADYRRRGMELPEEEFQKVVKLQKELASLCTVFQQNISEDKTEVHFTVDELKGVPESVLSALQRTEAGECTLKMDYPTYFAVMKNCEVASTRQAMAQAFTNRAYPVNDKVLKDIIEKRHQLAVILGYPSFAHLYISDKMAKTPEMAQTFVESLIPKLQKKWTAEVELLKKHLHPSCSLSPAGDIEAYDIPFMINQIKKTLLNVSETAIQEYFPMDATVKALFDIYQSFFDVTFLQVDNGSELWHSDAKTLEVNDNKSGCVLGYIILDLFPREGKYSHACCHSVVPPVLLKEGGNDFSPALAVVISNFPAATADRPALFLHDDVETFFHEFGHAIHSLMGRTRMATFAGTRVKRDFVELPSQMLEEWLWEPEILQKITSHYKTKEQLPRTLIDAKVASKNAFSGRDTLRQLQFATYSLQIFGLPFSTQPRDNLDTTQLFYDLEPRVMPGVNYEHNTHFESAFGHLTGYGAGYYGYMWSKVFALDLFEYIRSHNGLLDPKMGRRYVDCIIGVGGSQDPNDMLVKFLGREPNNEAFLRNIGV
ncbi:putative thimet oligopeptidase [Leishmania major strain Friedlin]|uniref:Putative thimet oligopeptidase n=1 Tax=Leishmania major TaxID=5664 RepID=Q4Q937_LEIMA|nr:putative thimet oligopeptidase [Leishmania major strain Friedlin]CAG9576478.1 thimet_oligopeptidase_-_putative [Leishmania major strain Friedlin]CAJ05325.1 putative thimet oligopeptidase [Leishmania major strain Friedlin]|eukprot:XP_001684161.1 putative thimet oligopeptidase [Leishmania major strain Friedlin]